MELKERLIRQVQDVQNEMNTLENRKKSIFSDYAQAFCPYKVGDTVEILGYFFTGKMGIVKEVDAFYATYNSRIYWIVRGTVLKKDGNEMNGEFAFSEEHYNRYLVKQQKSKTVGVVENKA